jgi:hypothetical protein
MYKNVASQYVHFVARDLIADCPKTGDAANITVYVTVDNSAIAAATNSVAEISSTNAPGVYKLLLTQAETNGGMITVSAVSSTAGVEIQPVIIATVPFDSNGGVDVTKIGSDADLVASLEKAVKVLVNKAVQSKSSGEIVYYDDDGVTELVTHTPVESENCLTRLCE